MSGFDKVELKWKGQSFVIEPRNVLQLIARVEEVITVDELVKYAARQTAPMAKLTSGVLWLTEQHFVTQAHRYRTTIYLRASFQATTRRR